MPMYSSMAASREIDRRSISRVRLAISRRPAVQRRSASGGTARIAAKGVRSEEHTSELQSLMRISYAVFCLKKKNNRKQIDVYYITHTTIHTMTSIQTHIRDM